ncbi:hypothetical protein NKI51_23395 [Mesorhizobium australicum]|uniref:hypothetical protein n=1 Tax=Mesorhizobium australicum TaxID=536018 RepID=UPI00333576D5
MRFDALNRLWESVRASSHDFDISTQVFPNLDVDRVSNDLGLATKGAERGSVDEPSSDSAGLDEIELAVVERVEEEKKAAHQLLEDEMRTFSERLTNLDFDGQFVMTKQTNATTVTDYIAEWQGGIDQLHGLRRALDDAERERTSFRRDHRLDRAARTQSTTIKVLKILFLVVCVIFETGFNGTFLAAGSDQGLIGGTTLAAGFSFLNIGSATLAAFWVKYSRHRSVAGKLFGSAIVILYLAFAGSINLALAHYRETSETLFGKAGQEVIRRLHDAPFQLDDIESWILFGVGVSFSIAAFIDAWFLADPYPGYSGVEARLGKRRATYVETRLHLIERLQDVRDEYTNKITEIVRGLGARKREYDAIISHRGRIVQLFEEHQNHLERAANLLLATYREANRKARSASPPKHFTESYRLERIKPPYKLIGELNDDELSESIKRARDELTDQAQRMADEFAKAVDRYHNLDKLHPDQVDVQTQA